MIRFVYNKDIERRRWNDCIERASNGNIYALSWFLDGMCGSNWHALIEDDYISVFPLTSSKKLGISYLYQPFFMQQLGLFGNDIPESKLEEYIIRLSKIYPYVDIQLNISNTLSPDTLLNLRKSGAPAIAARRKTHLLNLDKDYTELSDSYSENTSRNIKKALKNNIQVLPEMNFESFMDFYIEHGGKKAPEIKLHQYDLLRKSIKGFLDRDKILLYKAVNQQGQTLAVAAFPMNRVYLLAASSEEGISKCAMFTLVDQYIKDFAGQPVILDFEGSMIDSVSRFYKGFGAEEVYYPHLKINRLPLPLRLFKK